MIGDPQFTSLEHGGHTFDQLPLAGICRGERLNRNPVLPLQHLDNRITKRISLPPDTQPTVPRVFLIELPESLALLVIRQPTEPVNFDNSDGTEGTVALI